MVISIKLKKCESQSHSQDRKGETSSFAPLKTTWSTSCVSLPHRAFFASYFADTLPSSSFVPPEGHNFSSLETDPNATRAPWYHVRDLFHTLRDEFPSHAIDPDHVNICKCDQQSKQNHTWKQSKPSLLKGCQSKVVFYYQLFCCITPKSFRHSFLTEFPYYSPWLHQIMVSHLLAASPKNGSFSEAFPKISTGNKQRPWGLLGTNFASEIHLHLN